MPQHTNTTVVLSAVRTMAGNCLAKKSKTSDDPALKGGVAKTVKNFHDYVQSQQRQIRLKVDNENGQAVINVLDSTTDEVVRNIPSEELLAVSGRLYKTCER